jgi:hypothetical protein
MTGRHLLSHSFTEKGQRKKIIDDHDKLCSEIEISNFFQTTKFSNIDINSMNISLMFVQTFRSHFSEEIFYGLCLNGSVHRYAYLFNKHTKTN